MHGLRRSKEATNDGSMLSTYHVAGGCCEGDDRGGATLEEELMHQKILKELREIKGMDWLFVLAAFIAGILLGMSWQFLHSN